MSNLPEQVSWESGIHQLEEADRAKAGPGGVLNIQANQLANRTRWLRALVESAQDYREYTFYKSESDPDGTIAGNANTPAGKIFRVAQGLSDEFAFIYYLNDSGTATPITALLGRGAIINNVREYSALMLAENDVAAGNILEGSKCWVTDLTHETLAVEYVNSSGTLEPTGRKMPSQEAVDALARHFDGSNPDLLIGFKDALNKVFASWNLAGQYVGDLEYAQWDENGRMYADLALLGDIKIVKTYQNPDVAFYILDANGRVMLEIPLVESESDSDEKIQEIETRLDVATRTDGLLKSEFFGLNFLSETRRALMMAEAKEGQLIINIIGNSWVHNEWNLPRRLTQVLQDRFGDAGAGFAGYNRNFAHPGRAFLIVQSGTWTEETVTTPTGTNFGPAGSQGVTSTAGASMAFQSLTGDTSAAIYHNADSSVSPVIKIKYRDNVSGTSTEETQLTLTGTGVTRTELPAPPVTGNWTATLTLVSGTLAFCGIELKKSTPGVRVNKLGTGGSTWRQWTTLNRAGWVQGITPMAANLNILLESVNGAYSYDADAEAGY
ncbi:hypothetical protein ACT03O_20420, partial [Klebsiella quasipneumoniae]